MFSSVSQSCPTLCDPMKCSTLGLPVYHQLPELYSNSCLSSQWCHPTISSSVVLFSCPQSFPASGSFPMSQLFSSGGQSIGASASVLPMNLQDWLVWDSFRIDWFDLPVVQGTLKSLLHAGDSVSNPRGSGKVLFKWKEERLPRFRGEGGWEHGWRVRSETAGNFEILRRRGYNAEAKKEAGRGASKHAAAAGGSRSSGASSPSWLSGRMARTGLTA